MNYEDQSYREIPKFISWYKAKPHIRLENGKWRVYCNGQNSFYNTKAILFASFLNEKRFVKTSDRLAFLKGRHVMPPEFGYEQTGVVIYDRKQK